MFYLTDLHFSINLWALFNGMMSRERNLLVLHPHPFHVFSLFAAKLSPSFLDLIHFSHAGSSAAPYSDTMVPEKAKEFSTVNKRAHIFALDMSKSHFYPSLDIKVF